MREFIETFILENLEQPNLSSLAMPEKEKRREGVEEGMDQELQIKLCTKLERSDLIPILKIYN